MTERPSHAMPEHPDLAVVATMLERGRLAGEVMDHEWRVVYVSSELRALLGEEDEGKLALGTISLLRPIVAPSVWRMSPETISSWWRQEAPYMRWDLPAESAWIREHLGAKASAFESVEPREPPPAWVGKFSTTYSDGDSSAVGRLVVRLNGRGGEGVGQLGVYVGGGLRGSVQAMLARGDAGMFERMAALTDPDRRPAAVLFADLEASGVISRRLSTKAYFTLIRELTTAIDAAVVEGAGIVGKHVGDGVSAFFLAEQCGGEQQAAAAAVQAALSIRERAAGIEAPGGPININMGVHWGATLVIGQVVTDGRLEVTALGDEVNAAARIQELARAGQALASKDVIERLPAALADELGLDPDRTRYEILAEVEHASEKARRDAGGLAICELPARPAGA